MNKSRKPLIIALLIFAVIVNLIRGAIFNHKDKPVKTNEEVVEEVVEEKEEKPKEEPKEDTLKEKIGLIGPSDVIGDKTGRWRHSEYASSDKQIDIALEYYNEYFESNDEIHALINFSTKTTASIAVYGCDLYVTIHEYVKKEEHDADLLFSGMVLQDYIVNIESGEIEEITE